jgi:hypothetical protein
LRTGCCWREKYLRCVGYHELNSLFLIGGVDIQQYVFLPRIGIEIIAEVYNTILTQIDFIIIPFVVEIFERSLGKSTQ